MTVGIRCVLQTTAQPGISVWSAEWLSVYMPSFMEGRSRGGEECLILTFSLVHACKWGSMWYIVPILKSLKNSVLVTFPKSLCQVRSWRRSSLCVDLLYIKNAAANSKQGESLQKVDLGIFFVLIYERQMKWLPAVGSPWRSGLNTGKGEHHG